MGGDYQEMVNKVRAKEGLAPDFEARPSYARPVSENKLLFENPRSGQIYFRVYFGYGATHNKSVKHYDAYGDEISPEEMKVVKAEYLKKESESSRQGTEQEVVVRNYKVENVTKFKRYETWLDAEKEVQ